MTSAQVVETSVTNNSPFQDYTHPADHTRRAIVNVCFVNTYPVGSDLSGG